MGTTKTKKIVIDTSTIIGTTGDKVSAGNHGHAGEYSPADHTHDPGTGGDGDGGYVIQGITKEVSFYYDTWVDEDGGVHSPASPGQHTWIIPANVQQIEMTMIGAGGGGSGGNNNYNTSWPWGGAGGGSGAYVIDVLANVDVGEMLTILVGKQGFGGGHDADGNEVTMEWNRSYPGYDGEPTSVSFQTNNLYNTSVPGGSGGDGRDVNYNPALPGGLIGGRGSEGRLIAQTSYQGITYYNVYHYASDGGNGQDSVTFSGGAGGDGNYAFLGVVGGQLTYQGSQTGSGGGGAASYFGQGGDGDGTYSSPTNAGGNGAGGGGGTGRGRGSHASHGFVKIKYLI